MFRTRIIKKIEIIILLLFHNENVIFTMAGQRFLIKLKEASEKGNNKTSLLVNALLKYKDIKVIYNEDTGIYSIFTYKDYLYKKISKDLGVIFPRGFNVIINGDNDIERVNSFYGKFENIKSTDYEKFMNENGYLYLSVKVSGTLIMVSCKDRKLIIATKKSLNDNNKFTNLAKEVLDKKLGHKKEDFIKFIDENKYCLSFELASADANLGEHASKIEKTHLVLLSIYDNNTNTYLELLTIEEILKDKFPEITVVSYLKIRATPENIETIQNFYEETKSKTEMTFTQIWTDGFVQLFGDSAVVGGNYDYLEMYGDMLEGVIISRDDNTFLAKMKYLRYVRMTMLFRNIFKNIKDDKKINIEEMVNKLFNNFGYTGNETLIDDLNNWKDYLTKNKESLEMSYLAHYDIFKQML